jgi:gamma-tubulin complex component 4
LDVYRSAVLQIEQHLARPPAPPLLSLQHFLADFEVLLPEVARVAGEVQRAGLAGGGVMRLLELRTRSGVPAVQSCARRLLWHCNQVLFKQLDSWLVHGLLLDPGDEFFIKRVGGSGAGGAGGADEWSPLEWHDGFAVDSTALPPDVSLPTAHAALFIGKAVRVLRRPSGGGGAAVAAADAHSELLDFSATLRALQRQELLRAVAVEHAVEGMRGRVAALLWGLVQQRCDLGAQLAAMQSYFLLGRGDLYQQFLQDAAPLLAAPPRAATADADAALAFRQSAAAGAAEADPLFASVSLGWMDAGGAGAAAGESASDGDIPAWHPARCTSLAAPSYDAWDGLFLRCEVGWPLQLLFPPEVLRKYGVLWQYMFRLKRAQLDLEAAWAALQAMARPGRTGARAAAAHAPRALRLQLSQLRQRMAHFVANLALYVQLDVVTAAAAALRRRVAAAADFSDADAAHRAFVDALVAQTFLDMRQVVGLVEGLFGLCRRLCALTTDLEGGGLDPGAAAPAAAALALEFRAKHNLLYQLLQSSTLQSHQRAPSLRQLVLRLNFNEFCGREAVRHLRSQGGGGGGGGGGAAAGSS